MLKAPRKPFKFDPPVLTPHWHAQGCKCEIAQPYIRVSRVGKREEIMSPRDQLRSIESYARTKSLRLLPPIFDIDRSGRTFRKRSVEKIIADIKANKNNCKRVVLWKWSRWARNVEESTRYLAKVRDAGGRVDAATEDFDQETAVGRLQRGIIMQFDEYQSDIISEGWIGAHEMRREDGLPHSGRARFGYVYAGKRFEPDPEWAPLLRDAYISYISGRSWNAILRDFHAAGAKTTLGGEFTAQGLARLLDTGFAAGLIRERSQPTGAPANSIASYDVWRAGIHEPIIDRAVWDKYKAKRIAMAELPPRSRKAVHGLSAMLFCAVCKRRMVTKYAGAGRTHMWQCAYQKSFHPGVAVQVSNALTLDAVHDWVRAVHGGEFDWRQAHADLAAQAGNEEPGSESDRLRLRIRQLEGRIESLIDTIESVRGTARDSMSERINRYQDEIDQLTEQITEAEPTPVPEFTDQDQAALESLDAVWSDLEPPELRLALSSLLSRIEVSPRTESSSRGTVKDRVRPVGLWEAPALEDWRSM